MRRQLLIATSLILIATAPRVISASLVTDSFSYPDGDLTIVSGGLWIAHDDAGSTPFEVSSGTTLVDQGPGNREDIHISFTSTTTGTLYYGFDFSVEALGSDFSGADEFFAHFNFTGSLVSRLFITTPNTPATAGVQYSIGLSTVDDDVDTKWATDLSPNTTYRAVVGYNFDTDRAQLWINPVNIGSTSILGDIETDIVSSISAFSFRQANTGPDENIRIDNFVVSTSFSEVAAVPEPGAFLFGGSICGVMGLAAGGRRLKRFCFSRRGANCADTRRQLP